MNAEHYFANKTINNRCYGEIWGFVKGASQHIITVFQCSRKVFKE